MTYEEALQKLAPAGQEHILKYYDELGEEQKNGLLKQVEELDLSLLDLLKKEDKRLWMKEISPSMLQTSPAQL